MRVQREPFAAFRLLAAGGSLGGELGGALRVSTSRLGVLATGCPFLTGWKLVGYWTV